MNKILAVVVSYNRLALLQQCLQALLGQTAACDTLVVDNASTDDTKAWLEAFASGHETLYCETMEKNLGGAGGFRFGMEWGLQHGYDYIWLMDDDTLPRPDALEKLMEADEILGGPNNYGFLSSTVLWKDGKECIMNHQRVVRHFYRYVHLLRYGILQIQQATFVSLLLPASTIRRFGYVFGEYFVWNDDIEYTRRIALKGKMPSFLVGQSVVIHAMEKNIGSDISTDDIAKLKRYQMMYRNEHNTYRREGLSGLLIYSVRWTRDIFRILVRAKDHRFKRIFAVLKGVIQGVFFRPVIEYPKDRPNGKTCD